MQQGDRGDRESAGEIGNDRTDLVSEAIDDRPAKDPGDDDGEERKEGRDSGFRGGTGRNQHEPWDRQGGEVIADKGYRVGGKQRVKRTGVRQGAIHDWRRIDGWYEKTNSRGDDKSKRSGVEH